MKAASRLLSAAAALVLSAFVAVPGALVGQCLFVTAAQAAVVSSIDVRGNQRIDAETVRSYVGIKPGKAFSGADIDDGVKKLFATGLFSDVRINQVGGTLVIQVSENAVVNQVLFQGNKKIKDADLARAVQVKPRGSYSADTLGQDVDAVKDAYRRVGRDDAEVTTQIVDLGENRVNVVFNINEGGRTKIASINFVGNKAFSNRRLADVLATKRSSLLSFVFRDDVYDADKLRADEEALRRFYFNHGYADFQVVSSSADLDPATNQYTINITLDEGERYNFGDVSVESSIPGVDGGALRSLVKTSTGEVYSADKVENSIVALTEKLAGMGYAFAQVTPRGDRNFENRTIAVAYTVDQGARTYIERIEIRGNSRTRDYVIRREFDVSEGDAFNQVLIQRAKRRLEKLDYFTTVNVSTAPGSAPDQVVLVVDVLEKSTGEFSAGAGYSTGDSSTGGKGINVSGSVSEKNFLGRGQFIKVSAGGSSSSRDYSLSFTEPYFLGRRIAAGFDIYRQTRDYDKYDQETTGATFRLGLPITQALSTTLAYNISKEEYGYSDCDDNDNDVQGDCGLSNAVIQGIETSPWIKSSVSATLTYNTIDDIKNPHDGLYATFTTEAAGLGGDAKFLKFTARSTYYRTLSQEQDIVGLATIGGGHITAWGGGDLRIFDLFESNDRIIRGFKFNGMGPRDVSAGVDTDGSFLGGASYVNASLEAQFPLPAVPQSLGLRGAVFADAASLFDNDLNVPGVDLGSTSDFNLRASVGLGLLWASPFGPLRIDYAVPVLKESGDQVQNFNFGVSTRF